MMLVLGKNEDDVDELEYLSDWDNLYPIEMRSPSLSKVARLEDVCRSLESNDPAREDVDLLDFYFDNDGKLGSALQHNSHVSRITVDVPTLQSGGVIAAIHWRIGTSQTLRQVHLYEDQPYFDNHRVAKSLVLAIAQNANITELELDVFDAFSFSALVWVVKANLPSLKSLTFRISEALNVPTIAVSLLASAFEANQTFESLKITNPSSLEVVTQAILMRLTSHHCLRRLTCSAFHDGYFSEEPIEYGDILSAILMGSTPLTSLSICGIELDDIQMLRLVEALKCSDALTSLAFDECGLSASAKGILATYLRTEVSLSPLRSLKVSSRPVLFAETFLPCLRTPTFAIGSTLQTLSVILHVDDPFWDELYANAENVRLLKLVYGVYKVDPKVKDILFRSIPKFVHLRELCVKYVGHTALDEEFIDAVRRNGSLHRANCQKLYGAAPRPLEKADVYCSRNRLVPELLAGPSQKALPVACHFVPGFLPLSFRQHALSQTTLCWGCSQ
jgi:hypothetical protein